MFGTSTTRQALVRQPEVRDYVHQREQSNYALTNNRGSRWPVPGMHQRAA
jgi:hypothetical protein